MNRDRLAEQLIRDEGLRLKPYLDTVKKLTIGVGRNLSDRGITQAEAMMLLNYDMDVADLDCRANFPWFDTIDDVRQGVLVNMCFNLGISRLLKFKNTLALVQAHEYDKASIQMLQSLWAEQVGDRALRLAEQMRTGRWV
jgi:lysozyme